MKLKLLNLPSDFRIDRRKTMLKRVSDLNNGSSQASKKTVPQRLCEVIEIGQKWFPNELLALIYEYEKQAPIQWEQIYPRISCVQSISDQNRARRQNVRYDAISITVEQDIGRGGAWFTSDRTFGEGCVQTWSIQLTSVPKTSINFPKNPDGIEIGIIPRNVAPELFNQRRYVLTSRYGKACYNYYSSRFGDGGYDHFGNENTAIIVSVDIERKTLSLEIDGRGSYMRGQHGLHERVFHKDIFTNIDNIQDFSPYVSVRFRGQSISVI